MQQLLYESVFELRLYSSCSTSHCSWSLRCTAAALRLITLESELYSSCFTSYYFSNSCSTALALRTITLRVQAYSACSTNHYTLELSLYGAYSTSHCSSSWSYTAAALPVTGHYSSSLTHTRLALRVIILRVQAYSACSTNQYSSR